MILMLCVFKMCVSWCWCWVCCGFWEILCIDFFVGTSRCATIRVECRDRFWCLILEEIFDGWVWGFWWIDCDMLCICESWWFWGMSLELLWCGDWADICLIDARVIVTRRWRRVGDLVCWFVKMWCKRVCYLLCDWCRNLWFWMLCFYCFWCILWDCSIRRWWCNVSE